ncbi:MAG: nuclear transport factor 2 family protein [Rhodospirillales bacterium]|nr:nuclear transport factor 2 family protein [Rhodospirillales bacterium]
MSAGAAAQSLHDTAKAQLIAFIEAVIGGPKALEKILAPEYQLMRGNGVGFDRDGYISRGVGTVSIKRGFSPEEIVVTRSGGIMVVRYMLRITETIDGKPVAKRAPRLTVFRNIGGKWMVTAHANFAVTQ